MPEPYLLYLDQMFRLDVAQALRDEGHDVIRSSEVGQDRADDYEILQKAIAENRILVTLDEHFGDWVILPLSKHPGVIRLKVNPTRQQTLFSFFCHFFASTLPENSKTILLSSHQNEQNGSLPTEVILGSQAEGRS